MKLTDPDLKVGALLVFNKNLPGVKKYVEDPFRGQNFNGQVAEVLEIRISGLLRLWWPGLNEETCSFWCDYFTPVNKK